MPPSTVTTFWPWTVHSQRPLRGSHTLSPSSADVGRRTRQALGSAILALTQVLEKRRRLLKASLFRDDEVALFVIANKFDLRHLDEKQHTDYDPAFLDWVFWWYLATVELTDRLLARRRGQAAATAT
jgi:hypothetical protein